MWNDFATEQSVPQHRGLKWHRHPGESHYHYDGPHFRKALSAISRRGLRVTLEEGFHNALLSANQLAREARAIIPYLGLLNGGYGALGEVGIRERDTSYADTSGAAPGDIERYASEYGSQRIMFGSDLSFFIPEADCEKTRKLNLPDRAQTAILGQNLRRLLGED